MGEPSTNRERIDLLVQHGWLPSEMLQTLHDILGFSNVLVQSYAAVDTSRVRYSVENELDDLLACVNRIRTRLSIAE